MPHVTRLWTCTGRHVLRTRWSSRQVACCSIVTAWRRLSPCMGQGTWQVRTQQGKRRPASRPSVPRGPRSPAPAVCSILEVQESKEVAVVGTLYKNMKWVRGCAR